MFAKLPLSTRILLMLNPSILSMITKGSLWGYLTPLASASLKDMSWSIRFCLNGGIVWTLLTCLWYAFLRDLNDPDVKGPPVIVFISLITFWGGWGWWPSFLNEDSYWLRWSLRDLLYSFFFTYFYNFPFRISSSTCSFRSLQSSVLWPWSLWNRQYLFLSWTLGDECNGLGHLR